MRNEKKNLKLYSLLTHKEFIQKKIICKKNKQQNFNFIKKNKVRFIVNEKKSILFVFIFFFSDLWMLDLQPKGN
jgi:hypothetical protein